MGIVLGSKSKYFNQDKATLFECRDKVFRFLDLKGYGINEIEVYLKAFDYFCDDTNAFDGATIVKDLHDLPHLDLDAMLHDYHYMVNNAASNFVTKWKADWIYAKGNERKGKGQYSAFSRFVGLTIIGVGFVPYARLKRGKLTPFQRKEITRDYYLLIH
ncbi:hypothetical protein [Flavobacterium granuli]|uniref:Uncharacterized protein n=1 Tax=Flavobacterium granuli TaxID=280093 RepID=A0ABU1S0R2_9FLAO|nr:hypothetical protein [Flavobacterium granuli]MDR6844497.1 hypothetical protein [Flavobacterium granuli]